MALSKPTGIKLTAMMVAGVSQAPVAHADQVLGQQAVCALLRDFAGRYKPLHDAYYKEKNAVVRDRIGEQSDALRKERDAKLGELIGKLGSRMDEWSVKIDKIASGFGTPKPVSMSLNPHCGEGITLSAENLPLTPELSDQIAAIKVGEEITISGKFRQLMPAAWPGKGWVSGVFESSSMTEPGLMITNWTIGPAGK